MSVGAARDLFCREGLNEMGLSLYPRADSIPSPTVTAVNVPEGLVWEDIDARFRRRGLVVGGNYGLLSGKVFRLGHMGSQADLELVQKALDVIKKVVEEEEEELQHGYTQLQSPGLGQKCRAGG